MSTTYFGHCCSNELCAYNYLEEEWVKLLIVSFNDSFEESFDGLFFEDSFAYNSSLQGKAILQEVVQEYLSWITSFCGRIVPILRDYFIWLLDNGYQIPNLRDHSYWLRFFHSFIYTQRERNNIGNRRTTVVGLDEFLKQRFGEEVPKVLPPRGYSNILSYALRDLQHSLSRFIYRQVTGIQRILIDLNFNLDEDIKQGILEAVLGTEKLDTKALKGKTRIIKFIREHRQSLGLKRANFVVDLKTVLRYPTPYLKDSISTLAMPNLRRITIDTEVLYYLLKEAFDRQPQAFLDILPFYGLPPLAEFRKKQDEWFRTVFHDQFFDDRFVLLTYDGNNFYNDLD